ncbi:MAG TPA: DUF1501 domain-containing protein [Nevskiaceae bacterium]|nr:DUF1501 domain-containing protein [Nevskiaceae bacterium]
MDLPRMDRRAFVKRLIASGAVCATGGYSGLAHAGFAAVNRPILADLMLLGGPDLRHLMPPAYDSNTSSFGHRYWKARHRSHGLGALTGEWKSRWDDDYFHCSSGGTSFGILRKAGWLYDMWSAGHVAVVPNSFGGQSRDHEHCTLVLDQGNLSSGPNDHGRSGWGGRLGQVLGTGVTSLTVTPRPFCYGPLGSDPEGSTDVAVIGASDTRRMGLFYPPSNWDSRWDSRARLGRGLAAYYAEKDRTMRAGARQRRLVDLERKTRQFGEAVNDRLASVPLPSELVSLYSGDAPLNNTNFGLQVRNLHDALACNDILDLRVTSLEYGNWDSHKDQRAMIEPNFEDIFGRGKGLSQLYATLPADARANLVIVVAGEFGRQIIDNGDQGSEHGLGNSVLVIGEPVNGGVYGTLFPASEIAKLDSGHWGPDIDGLTAFDHTFGRVADWMQSGAGAQVFPNRASRPLEAGVNLAGMFA